MKTLFKILIAAGIFAFGTTVSAATVNYVLNLSNELDDGPIYADVVISDGVGGAIDFNVTVNTDEFNLAGATNFGMQTFAFNYDLTGLTGTPTIVDIDPTEWSVKDFNGSVGGFGKFEFDLVGSNNGGDAEDALRTTSLSFSIIGVDSDGIGTYANSNDGSAWFASHIGGFALTEAAGCDGDGCTSAFFAGSGGTRIITPPVPVPAAVWLFGSGLIGLVGVARRKVTDNNA